MLFKFVCAAFAASLLSGCLATFSPSDVSYFQPQIIKTVPPDDAVYPDFRSALRKLEMAPVVSTIPSYNGQGELFASWNPHPKGVAGRPTIVVIHGGHGLVGTNFVNAKWAQTALNANVLILDSYWSRGINENWATFTKYGVNMRVLDVIAAGRWLKTQGTDPSKTLLWGDSQGGWTVLRAFTDEPFISDQIKPLYAGGIAAYPNCIVKGSDLAPKLAPYTRPILLFTGGQDTATSINECSPDVYQSPNAQWTHFPNGTHGWDMASPRVRMDDGYCSKAANVYNPFQVCRSDAYTAEMRRKIRAYVETR